jgi:glycosyltransferase involved in cell wall biosynthesis
MPSPFNRLRQKYPKNLNQTLKHKAPVRILHVVGRMDRAGIETWLMRLLRRIDRKRFQIDILVHSATPGAYDAEVQAMGSRMFYCPFITKPWTYAIEFKRILSEQGPYDIVHSDVHFFGGYVLKLAKQAQVPCRIAHSHNDQRTVERQASWQRRVYVAVMKHWIRQSATHGLATSQSAAIDLFGEEWSQNPRINLLFCGLDLTLFEPAVPSVNLRQNWGIPADALVIGHVGRLELPKNHRFLLDIVAEAVGQQSDQEPPIYLMLVGEGALRSHLEQQAQALGIGDRVIFAGSQSDISSFLLGIFDVFLFPSLHEGLGVALLEAQAAGLPCLISETIPTEAEIIPTLVKRMSLKESEAEWAKALLIHAQSTPRLSVAETLPLIRQGPFNIENSVLTLTELYTHHLCPSNNVSSKAWSL